MPRDTRKVKKTDIMTIPQLRKAFQALESSTSSILAKKAKVNQVEAFQKEWKRIFKRPVSESAAKEYLEFKSREAAKKPLISEQKGGAAPLDYSMGPGTSEPYGNFPEYLSGGFLSPPADSFSAQCGKENATPVLPPSFGSNKVGGGGTSAKGKKTRRRQQRGGMARLMYATVPSSPLYDAEAALRGQLPSTPSPSAVDTTVARAYVPPPVITGRIVLTN
jgi:hypothetical protein